MVRSRSSAQPVVANLPVSARASQCLRAWGQRLRRQGYTRDAIQQVFGVQYAEELSAADREAWVARLGERSDAPSLWLRLFWLEAAVDWESAARHTGALVELGLQTKLLRRAGHKLHATLRAEPADGLIVWADQRFGNGARHNLLEQAGDPVYPPSADSFQLAHILPSVAGGRLLDLCTGSGVIALLAAKGRARAIGVDSDPRALAMARLNAEANRVRSAQFVAGDLYAPVAGQRFHCIAANPPFVCSPYTKAPKYHSGGPYGDAVLQRIVAGWTAHLDRGGRAVAIAQVGLRPGETLSQRAQAWLGEFDGRCLVTTFGRADVFAFAAQQASFALGEGLAAYRRELALWLRFLLRHGIREVAAILLAAERSGGQQLEVIHAVPVVVPVPLNKSATQVVRDWWSR